MKKRILTKTSVFPVNKEIVYNMLKRFDILSRVATPYMKFTPVNQAKDLIWQEGEVYRLKAKLFGFIPIGVHQITVIEFNQNTRIYTNEKDPLVAIWNHEIILKELGSNKTEYTDRVEIYAGWRTIFVYLFAKVFYAHRQKKWVKMLR